MTERSEQNVVHQDWYESERNWGIRPDGYSLHLSDTDREQYIRQYWDSMPKSTPDDYSFPGNHRIRFVEKSIYKKLERAKSLGRFGIRYP